MKVSVYPSDEGPCGSYRLTWPARALIAQGHDVDLVLPSDPQERQLEGVTVRRAGEERLIKTQIPDADVMVIQRPARQRQIDAMRIIQQQGIRVVVEIDDNFRDVDSANTAWAHVHPTLSPDRNYLLLAEACRQADLVTVTTPALAKLYAPHGRVKVIPNFVPESYLKINLLQPPTGTVVGWAGHLGVHPRDLQITGHAVERALGDARFVVVGDGEGVAEALGLRRRFTRFGYVPLDTYPWAVAHLDIGIVPLIDSAFNRSKSALKMLEYAALGVVPVVSPTPDNLRLHHDYGLGFIAAKPKDWERVLKALIRDGLYLAYYSVMGRAIAEELTIERNAHLWWEAWLSTLS